MSAWWNDQTAGLIGAIAGTAEGMLGAGIGTLAGILVPRGKCRKLIYGLMAFALLSGVGALIAGLAAVAMHQPYVVWYPLVLMGAMGTLLYSCLLPVVIGGYRKADVRRLEAEELRRS